MAPEIPDGSKVAASRSEAYEVGDLVIVWFHLEFVKPGGHPAIVKRLKMAAPPWVTGYPHREHPASECAAIVGLAMNSMPGKMMMVRCSEIAAIHLVAFALPPGSDNYELVGRLVEDRTAAGRVAASINYAKAAGQ